MCVHLKAAGSVVGFTHGMRAATATHLVDSGYIKVGEAGICTAPMLADMSREHTFRPAEQFCTCLDRMMHGVCCHLLAAPWLIEFQNVELLSGPSLPASQQGAAGGGLAR
jgi:hypothetical protein